MRQLFLDLGEMGAFLAPTHAHERWQNHGLGLLLTVLRRSDVPCDVLSLRNMHSWGELRMAIGDYDLLLMNVRSADYPKAVRAARIFKEVNPRGLVAVGGIHASVALPELERVVEVDRICVGAGENAIVSLASDPLSFPRISCGTPARAMDDWPLIDRTLWPKPFSPSPWPLEPECGWGPGPVATMLTSRVCPWSCGFCNERDYIQPLSRRSVLSVIEELNYLDSRYGPLGSVVFHDSMFFQHPRWLGEFLAEYPRRTHRPWPYWAAARADTVRMWSELFEALVRETNWHTVSIGFESGSTRVLDILGKGCTAEDNHFAIELLNHIGDDMEAKGQMPPKFFANVMLGVPGESRAEAMATMRMLEGMRRVVPSLSFFAPYPGSRLGNRTIAEGRSMLSPDSYHRYPTQAMVKGIDYRFYQALLSGDGDDEAGRFTRELIRAQGTKGIVLTGEGVRPL